MDFKFIKMKRVYSYIGATALVFQEVQKAGITPEIGPQ